jgi:protein-tyrosine phosphatase
MESDGRFHASISREKPMRLLILAGCAAAMLASAPAFADITGARVQRAGAAITVTWTSPDPVDVYVSTDPMAAPKAARLLSRADRDGAETFSASDNARLYFLLVDARDNKRVRAAERLLPLEQASNFRDVGGYPAAGGKQVRWGRIYRSGGQPMLSPRDLDAVGKLGLSAMIDLRSSEERVMAPSRIMGVPYQAVGYPMSSLMNPSQPIRNGADLYHRFPVLLAPQLKLIFQDLLSNQGAVVYNCSAGQDRTGFATAMVLAALGVSRETIVADYKLSTQYRRPEYEMPKISGDAANANAAAQVFASAQKDPAAAKPTPLVEADGRPFLAGAIDEIETKWGSVEAYLQKEVGVGPAELKKLRAIYLE